MLVFTANLGACIVDARFIADSQHHRLDESTVAPGWTANTSNASIVRGPLKANESRTATVHVAVPKNTSVVKDTIRLNISSGGHAWANTTADVSVEEQESQDTDSDGDDSAKNENEDSSEETQGGGGGGFVAATSSPPWWAVFLKPEMMVPVLAVAGVLLWWGRD